MSICLWRLTKRKPVTDDQTRLGPASDDHIAQILVVPLHGCLPLSYRNAFVPKLTEGEKVLAILRVLVDAPGSFGK